MTEWWNGFSVGVSVGAWTVIIGIAGLAWSAWRREKRRSPGQTFDSEPPTG